MKKPLFAGAFSTAKTSPLHTYPQKLQQNLAIFHKQDYINPSGQQPLPYQQLEGYHMNIAIFPCIRWFNLDHVLSAGFP
ncbi:hypothetical protein [Cardiobacterium hominis]|uniref:hypothetical protein n=1 Tax=Cardiobacterium hominis TaxID=2718 RepID=UPI0028D3D7CE|nr:hypothetical protein [Cardiobacterium hominis]